MSIETYKSKKVVIEKSMAKGEVSSAADDSRGIKWVAPKSWTAQKTNSIRFGSFKLPTIKNAKGEVSIIALAGDGGGLLANINRWRGQISLPDQSLAEVQSELTKIVGKLGNFNYLLIENKNSNKAIAVAFIEYKGKSIFVKANGDSSVVKKSISEFKEFVKGMYEN